MSAIRHWFALAAMTVAVPAASAMAQERWIESWGTALPLQPPPPPPAFRPPPPPEVPANALPAAAPPPAVPSPFVAYPASFADQTIRMVLRASAGGRQVRLEFANANGGEPVHIGAVHAALAASGGAIVPGSDRVVTFGGKTGLALAPGAKAVSDPVELAVPPMAQMAVSIHLPGPTPANTVDPLGLMPTYIVPGNQVAAAQLADPMVASSYFWLKGLSVPAADEEAGTIVALGDSITEGYATTAGANRSWPELLAQRLQDDPGFSSWGVINVGISGNRILKAGVGDAAVARFTDDVLARPGVKWVMILEGINDINMSIMPGMPDSENVTAEAIIAGLDQLVSRAHLHGIRVAGGTILPTKGLPFYTAEGEVLRQDVNHWIRTSGRFDMVVDFDAATRDPADPLRLLPAFDPGDHVHPNDAGNQAMADAIDLDLLN